MLTKRVTALIYIFLAWTLGSIVATAPDRYGPNTTNDLAAVGNRASQW